MLRAPQGAANRLNRAVHRMALNGRPYAESYLFTAAAVFDECLFSQTVQAGTLVRRINEMIARHHDQQAEQQRRFDRALTCLPDLLADPDIVQDPARARRAWLALHGQEC